MANKGVWQAPVAGMYWGVASLTTTRVPGTTVELYCFITPLLSLSRSLAHTTPMKLLLVTVRMVPLPQDESGGTQTVRCELHTL